MDRAPGTAPRRAHLVLVGAEPDPSAPDPAELRVSPVPGLARLVRPVLAPPQAAGRGGRSLAEVLDRVRRDAGSEPARWLAELAAGSPGTGR